MPIGLPLIASHQKRIILWSHPRSRSTAFERAFIEREDCYVVHEPTSLALYFGQEITDIMRALECVGRAPLPHVLSDVCYRTPHSHHVFIKDFAYHCASHLSDQFLSQFKHVILVRKPEETIRSFHAIHPDFQVWEVGYHELYWLARRLRSLGHAPVLVDAQQLVDTPQEIMKSVCEWTGLPFSPAMINWKHREVMPSWERWDRFHKVALESRILGGISVKEREPALIPKRAGLIHYLEPIYEAIFNEFATLIR